MLRVWLGLLATMLCCAQAIGQSAAQSPDKQFIVFDGTLYQKKPDLRAAGLEPIYIAYEGSLFRERDRALREPGAMPDPDLMGKELFAARAAGSRLVVIDIEVWSVARSDRFPKQVPEAIARFQETVTLARRLAPDLDIGLFSPLPVHSGYERYLPIGSDLQRQMVIDNDKLVGLASMVDAIFPIGYTYSTDRTEWERAIGQSVSEARRLRKDAPVYVFIWPQYADYGPVPKELHRQWLPADYWRYQLDTMYESADGVVIWGGWNNEQGGRRKWDDEAAWWQATREFIRDKGLTRRPKAPVLNR